MEKVKKEMREVLRMPLPTGAVSKHPTKTFLSSIKAIYITERLNKGIWCRFMANTCRTHHHDREKHGCY